MSSWKILGFSFVIFTLITFNLVSCSKPETNTPSIGKEFVVLGTMTAAGGKMCAANGLCLEYPEGAVESDVKIEVRFSNQEDPTVIGPILELKSEVETFKKEIKLTLPVAKEHQSTGWDVGFRKEDGTWEKVPTTSSDGGKFQIGVTNHLSLWALLCPGGQKYCSSAASCVDVRTDPKHCGACDNVCSSSQSCVFGTCKVAGGETQEREKVNESVAIENVVSQEKEDHSDAGSELTPTKEDSIEDSFDGGLTKEEHLKESMPENQKEAVAEKAKEAAMETAKEGSFESSKEVVAEDTNLQEGTSNDNMSTCKHTLCSGQCVELKSNPKHCGQCGISCGSGEVCCDGSCKKKTECNTSWYQRGGGSKSENYYGIRVDKQGNTYLFVYFQGESKFGSHTVKTSNPTTFLNSIAVIKLDPTGKWLWAVAPSSSKAITGVAMGIDDQGNTYITGYYQGEATFGTHSIKGKGSHEVFLAKVDKNGKFAWALSGGSSKADFAKALAVDDKGNVALVGVFDGTFEIGGKSLTTKGKNDVFVAKVDTTGKVLWANRIGGTDADDSRLVRCDSKGNTYVAGSAATIVHFGANTNVNTKGNDGFIAKIDAAGKFVWAKVTAASGNDSFQHLVVDGKGNIHIIGVLSQSGTFGTHTITTTKKVSVWLKIDEKGTWLAAKSLDGPTPFNEKYSFVGKAVADATGNLYLLGSLSGTTQFGGIQVTAKTDLDLMVAKLDSTGTYQWVKNYHSTVKYGISGMDLKLTSSGQLYIGGSFKGTATFGNKSVIATGSQNDAFLAKMDSTGNWLAIEKIGNAESERVVEIQIGPQDVPFIGGDIGYLVAKTDVFVSKRNP